MLHIILKIHHISRFEQAPGSGFHSRDKSEKIDFGFGTFSVQKCKNVKKNQIK